jgi:hypothetical protein
MISRMGVAFGSAGHGRERLDPWLPSQMIHARVADGDKPVGCRKDVGYAFLGKRSYRVCARVGRLPGVLALEGLVHGVAVCAVFVVCGEDEVGFVVLEHLQVLAASRRTHGPWSTPAAQELSYLLRTLCVNVLQRMLCLLLVVPHNVGKLGLLAGLGVDALLDRVDVADVVLPAARRRAPGLLDGPVSDLAAAALLRFVPLDDFSGRPPMSSKYSFNTSAAVSLRSLATACHSTSRRSAYMFSSGSQVRSLGFS